MSGSALGLPKRLHRWREARRRAHLEHRTPHVARALIKHAARQPEAGRDAWGSWLRRPVGRTGRPGQWQRESGADEIELERAAAGRERAEMEAGA